MIAILQQGHSQQELDGVLNRLEELGLRGHPIQGVERTVVAVIGQVFPELMDELGSMPGVTEVVRISKPYKLSSREVKPDNTVVDVNGVKIGDGSVVVMAGPCSVESEEQLMTVARAVKESGAHILRGGAFKPRTSPYGFRGLGVEGLKLLAQARAETGLPVITECMTVRDIDVVAQYSDIIQIGARNAQNFILLEEAAKAGKPVLLKRGFSELIEEWLLGAEYILNQGNRDVLLCERGIRTFETSTRNTLDINAIPMVKRLSHLPVVSDPSHGTGKWYLVDPVCLASVAAGADALEIEVHPNPDHALSDGAQSLTPENFDRLMVKLSALGEAVGRPLHPTEPVAAV
jgi:3-deoxy-7-phosphoheptulonate synthase